MAAVVLLLLIACSQIFAAAPTPPQLSETFNANLKLTVRDGKGEHEGTGVWGIDQPAGKGVETYDFDDNEYDIYSLERYDLGKQYQVISTNASKCQEFGVSGSMPLVWSWLSLATMVGRAGKGNQSVDIWEADIGYATMRLAVLSSDTTTPVFLIRESRDDRSSSYEFLSWSTTAPADKFFVVPSVCNSSTRALDDKKTDACVARDTAMARAKVWVAAKVPYDQGADYQGYREDCSGYVSMCWESSQPGHVTSTFYQISKPISKDDLQDGDCLLFAAEHVVLFGGWLDAGKTQYQAYEETKPGEGTVTRPTPYPYWYSQSSFLPYRYNDICT